MGAYCGEPIYALPMLVVRSARQNLFQKQNGLLWKIVVPRYLISKDNQPPPPDSGTPTNQAPKSNTGYTNPGSGFRQRKTLLPMNHDLHHFPFHVGDLTLLMLALGATILY